MTVQILDPLFQTQLVIGFLFFTLLFSSRRRSTPPTLSPTTSTELKGFAILAIVFAHIGYYLVTDHCFLFPLSILAGVGVDLFLFLSGYGLTHSMIHKQPTVWQFYLRRVTRVFVPFWIVLGLLLLIDRLFLGRSYPLNTILQSLIGFFPKANLYESLNAPFWYLTLLIFYYLLYPLFFWKKAPILSACILSMLGYYCVHTLKLPVDEGVLGSYKTHLFAFPLGMAIATVFTTPRARIQNILKAIETFFSKKTLPTILIQTGLMISLLTIACYFSIHSAVGTGAWHEQRLSLFTMACFIGVFLFKPFENRFLYFIGTYSYETYLIHWPLLYRYDILYPLLPGGIVTVTYLFIFLGISGILQQTTTAIFKQLKIR